MGPEQVSIQLGDESSLDCHAWAGVHDCEQTQALGDLIPN